MTAAEIVALLLEPDDREAVLGDLEEQGQPGWLRFFAVLDFAVRRQGEHWLNWRPWIAGSAALPISFLLLGASFRLSMDSRTLLLGGAWQGSLAYEAALTIAWAWASGCAISLLSPYTRGASLLLCMAPCFFCLLRFHEPSLGSPSLLLFLPPAILGAIAGPRWMRIGFTPAVALALGTTICMLLWRSMPVLYWLLSLPAWYLVWRSGRPSEMTGEI